MAWQNPKTDWKAGDVPAASDFNRIEGNTLYSKDEVDTHKAISASTTAKGHVQLNNTVTSTSTTQAATANAVKTVNDALTSHKAENASTTTKGHVQLSSSTSSTSTSLAATARAVKTVNDALTSHKTAAAPHSGHETPAGAQAKADAAAGAVQAQLDTHKAEDASQDNVHGLRDTNIAIGEDAQAGISSTVALGRLAKAEQYVSTAIGARSYADDWGIALGVDANAQGHSGAAIGQGASAVGRSLAVGRNAMATVRWSNAFGEESESNAEYASALGHRAISNNTREGVLGGSDSSTTNRWIVPGDFTVSGTKNFEIPHPKPEKKVTHVIRHGAVESPTPGDTLYRWKIQATKDNDIVTIDLPDYFIWLNKDVQVFVTPQGHFGNGYGTVNRETEQLEIHCQYEGEYNVLVIGTRNDDHQSVQDWDIKGVEREVGESWTGETYVFSVDEIIEIEEIKEVV